MPRLVPATRESPRIGLGHVANIGLFVVFAYMVRSLPSLIELQKNLLAYHKGVEDVHRAHHSTLESNRTTPLQPSSKNSTSRNHTVTSPPSQSPTVSPSSESNATKTVPWTRDAYNAIQAEGVVEDTRFLVEDEEGYINEDGQLVVNVDRSYLFWHHGQPLLCALVKNMTLVETLDSKADVPHTLLNATMDCVNTGGLGQGNWVTAIYQVRMTTLRAGVDFKFQCQDGQESKMKKLLPWFDQYIVATRTNRSSHVWPYGGDLPNEKESCPPKYPYLRIDHMAVQIQDDLRRMAVTLLGPRDAIRRHPDVPNDASPVIPNVQLDDAVIHFRCGDVMGGANRNDFGMIRFSEYKKWIPNTTESIGIVTQPFEAEDNRNEDKRKAALCRPVVYALVDYLQDFAPNATISIHNDRNETLPLTYARLVMANYSITSLSSFGIFPVIGTFGQGYFQRGNGGVNPFATYIPAILPNIHQMNAEVNPTGKMRGWSAEQLIAWFTNETNAS